MEKDPVTEADGTSNRDHWARLVKSPGALPAVQPKESTYPRFLLCGTCHELFEPNPRPASPRPSYAGAIRATSRHGLASTSTNTSGCANAAGSSR